MNKVILVGRLTKDPEVRYTQTGKVVATFTLAVDRYTGQGQKEADFIPVVVWGKVAEVCGNNLTKGQKVLVDGRLQVRSYEDKQGQRRWVTEVIGQLVEFLEWRSSQQGGGGSSYPSTGSAGNEKIDEGNFGPEIYPDDDVPF